MTRALALALAAACLACARPSPRVTSGDDAPEAFVGQARLREIFTRDGAFWVSPALAAPDGATRVALWLSTGTEHVDADLLLDARGIRDDGTTTAWLPADERWAEAPQRVMRVDLGEVVQGIEVRIAEASADALERLVYSAVVPDPAVSARVDAAVRTGLTAGAPSTARRGLQLPGVEPRSAWNARADAGCSANVNKDWISVHHSVSALQENASQATHAAAVRGIQSYHMDGRGYCDIGYHWATTADGTVWEAREAENLGAHTGNHNTNNAGIVFIGCFHPTADCNGLGATTPPQVMLDGGGAAIGTIAGHYGIPLNNTTVIGHRDNPDQTTSCPGDNLHDLLQTLREIAGGGTVIPPTTGTVQGVVWDLSITTDAALSDDLNARLPGATLAITGGPTTTARPDDSYWSFDLPPGTYTVTATLAGFAPASRQVQITAGTEQWASIGISPVAQAVELTISVTDAESTSAVRNATVTVTGADPQQTDVDGEVLFSLAAGALDIHVAAEGYEAQSLSRTFAAGAVETVDVALVAEEIIKPGEGEGEHDPNTPREVERVTILPADGGCGCAGSDPDESGPLVVVMLSLAMLGAAWRRRPAR